VALKDGWVFSTFTVSIVEGASVLCPAGCCIWQCRAAAEAHQRERERERERERDRQTKTETERQREEQARRVVSSWDFCFKHM
jgi:hypothetical protein